MAEAKAVELVGYHRYDSGTPYRIWKLLQDAPDLPASSAWREDVEGPDHAVAGDELWEDRDDRGQVFRLKRDDMLIGRPEWWQVSDLFGGEWPKWERETATARALRNTGGTGDKLVVFAGDAKWGARRWLVGRDFQGPTMHLPAGAVVFRRFEDAKWFWNPGDANVETAALPPEDAEALFAADVRPGTERIGPDVSRQGRVCVEAFNKAGTRVARRFCAVWKDGRFSMGSFEVTQLRNFVNRTADAPRPEWPDDLAAAVEAELAAALADEGKPPKEPWMSMLYDYDDARPFTRQVEKIQKAFTRWQLDQGWECARCGKHFKPAAINRRNCPQCVAEIKSVKAKVTD